MNHIVEIKLILYSSHKDINKEDMKDIGSSVCMIDKTESEKQEC